MSDKKYFNHPLYTAVRCTKAGKEYGRSHGSMDCAITTCGLEMDEQWIILTNAFDGTPQCEKCFRATQRPK
jgi:hypothetical protein